ncbi:MAG: molybdopterin dinucleotide binding domain-containing protein [Adlercreutzia equolifaciens]
MSPTSNPEMCEKYPFIATTGRRIPVYFHSEHRQLPWCRELWPAPRIEINPEDAAELGIEQGDWVWIENENGKIRQTADIYYGISKGVVNLEHQWWFPRVGSRRDGALTGAAATAWSPRARASEDPVTGSSYLRSYPVKIYKATPENSPSATRCPATAQRGGDHPSCQRLLPKEWLPQPLIERRA